MTRVWPEDDDDFWWDVDIDEPDDLPWDVDDAASDTE